MRENRFLKRLLIMQSFTPLFLLLIIKYWDVASLRMLFKFLGYILEKNVVLAFAKVRERLEFIPHTILLICCIALLLIEIVIYLYFRRSQTAGFADRAEKISVENDTTEASASFFVSYVTPMLMDDITEIKGFLCFLIIMLMLIMLMRNTNLYYQNPILSVIGYKTFEFRFTETSEDSLKDKNYIAITRGKFDETRIIKRKYISDNVFLIYNKN